MVIEGDELEENTRSEGKSPKSVRVRLNNVIGKALTPCTDLDDMEGDEDENTATEVFVGEDDDTANEVELDYAYPVELRQGLENLEFCR